MLGFGKIFEEMYDEANDDDDFMEYTKQEWTFCTGTTVKIPQLYKYNEQIRSFSWRFESARHEKLQHKITWH